MTVRGAAQGVPAGFRITTAGAREPVTFSVVIPAFNAERFVGSALDSVRSQTTPATEVIVVDDGSTDGTAARVAEWESKCGCAVRLIRQSNGGLPRARNVAMQAASATWIALLDADDVWTGDHLECLTRAVERVPDSVCAFGDYVEFDATGRETPSASRARALAAGEALAASPATYRLTTQLFTALLPGNFIDPSSSAFRAADALAVGGFDEELRTVEDRHFFLRLARRGPFAFSDSVVTRSRVHPDNLTHPRHAVRNTTNALLLLTKLAAEADALGLDAAERRRLGDEIGATIDALLYRASREGMGSYFRAVRNAASLGHRPSAWQPRHLARALIAECRRDSDAPALGRHG